VPRISDAPSVCLLNEMETCLRINAYFAFAAKYRPQFAALRQDFRLVAPDSAIH